jgi:hypothetical protein
VPSNRPEGLASGPCMAPREVRISNEQTSFMPNACPFLTFELGPTRIYVAALRAVLLQGECHLPDARESSHHPNSHGNAPSLPFLLTAISQEKRIWSKRLDLPKPKSAQTLLKVQILNSVTF